jgi:hypothetical protein
VNKPTHFLGKQKIEGLDYKKEKSCSFSFINGIFLQVKTTKAKI